MTGPAYRACAWKGQNTVPALAQPSRNSASIGRTGAYRLLLGHSAFDFGMALPCPFSDLPKVCLTAARGKNSVIASRPMRRRREGEKQEAWR